MLDSFDIYSRPLPNRRHSGDQLRARPPPLSRNNSSNSIRSEPGWGNQINSGSRSEPSSPGGLQTSKSTSALARFFGKSKEDKPKADKPKKERRGRDPIVLTARHAAAVRARQAAKDPNYKNDPNRGGYSAPLMVGTQNSQHLTAEQQAMRRPHSGPPTLAPAQDKIDSMGMLTRIISGDEADEPDERQRSRDEWKQTKIPGLLQVAERGTGSAHTSGTTTPEDRDLDPNYISPSKQNMGLPSVAEFPPYSEQFRPKPVRRITPIGLRWRKDENGVWKR